VVEITRNNVEIELESGKVTLELYPNVAPKTVESFKGLIVKGFYDGLKFHRVIPGFMAQGGDPIGNGTGNPGYKYEGEFSPEAGHDKAGVLRMANSGPNTDGSQFFITFKATPFLNNKHTVFGQVVSGLEETLFEIEKFGQRSGRTTEEVKIISAKIRVEDKTD